MVGARLGVAAALLALAGCGGGTSGRHVFAEDCARCHSLAGREEGAPAGDLAIPRLGVRDIASFARQMPVRPELTDAQAGAVARYIAATATKLRR